MDNPAYITMIEALHQAEQQVQIEREKRLAAEDRLSRIEHELAQLKRLIFGTKSERFVPGGDEAQLPLFEGAASGAVESDPQPVEVLHRKKKKKPVRQALPAHLPREIIVIEPAMDTSALKRIGEEITETLDYRPAKLVVIQRVRPKYVDPADERIIIGELPARPIDKGIAEAGLLASITIEKYADHLPLYRQVQRFKREGITLPSSTLEGWVRATADLLTPLYDRLVDEVRRSGYIQADETPIPVQDPRIKGKTHRGYYWVYHAPLEKLVALDYQRGRSRDGPKQFLQGYVGALQTDGYAAYDDIARWPDVVAYGCWAHARRYFFEAKENEPEWAEHALGEIARLYEIERAENLVRQEEALPILDRFKTWLEAHPGLPKSPWGQAVNYTLLRWDKLSRYAREERIEIDNNLVENAIRPIALGRKNYLFAGSHDAARRAAVIYSLLATCKKHDVNPQLWLSDVLARIPTHPHKQIEELLPHIWKKSKG